VSVAERFGQNLRRARKAAGLSHEAVAVRASLHRTEVGLLERGERIPRIDTAIKVAGAVGVDLAALTEGIDWTPGTASPGRFSSASEPPVPE
jgi:transcriptional regulator with XRE-family HTH domain